MKKEAFYKRLKIYGMVSFIPLMLATGPLTGYFLGSYLEERFGLAKSITFILIGLGFLAAVMETVRIIRLVTKIDNNF